MRIRDWSSDVCSSDLPDRCVLVGAYALGKAQRVIAELRAAGWQAPIYIHGALERMCALYADHGVDLGELRLVGESDKAEMAGQIVLAPPSALNRSEEHTSELQSLMRISYAVFCLKKKKLQ